MIFQSIFFVHLGGCRRAESLPKQNIIDTSIEANLQSMNEMLKNEDAEQVSDSSEYEIQSILAEKYSQASNRLFYLVKWAGWQIKYSTWEPECNLGNAQETIQQFHEKMEKGYMFNWKKYPQLTIFWENQENSEQSKPKQKKRRRRGRGRPKMIDKNYYPPKQKGSLTTRRRRRCQLKQLLEVDTIQISSDDLIIAPEKSNSQEIFRKNWKNQAKQRSNEIEQENQYENNMGKVDSEERRTEKNGQFPAESRAALQNSVDEEGLCFQNHEFTFGGEMKYHQKKEQERPSGRMSWQKSFTIEENSASIQNSQKNHSVPNNIADPSEIEEGSKQAMEYQKYEESSNKKMQFPSESSQVLHHSFNLQELAHKKLQYLVNMSQTSQQFFGAWQEESSSSANNFDAMIGEEEQDIVKGGIITPGSHVGGIIKKKVDSYCQTNDQQNFQIVGAMKGENTGELIYCVINKLDGSRAKLTEEMLLSLCPKTAFLFLKSYLRFDLQEKNAR